MFKKLRAKRAQSRDKQKAIDQTIIKDVENLFQAALDKKDPAEKLLALKAVQKDCSAKLIARGDIIFNKSPVALSSTLLCSGGLVAFPLGFLWIAVEPVTGVLVMAGALGTIGATASVGNKKIRKLKKEDPVFARLLNIMIEASDLEKTLIEQCDLSAVATSSKRNEALDACPALQKRFSEAVYKAGVEQVAKTAPPAQTPEKSKNAPRSFDKYKKFKR